MAVKEVPTNIGAYFNSMKEAITLKREKAVEHIDSLNNFIAINYEKIKSNIDVYKNSFKVDLNSYAEFVENKYIDGTFLKVTKGMFINRKNNYALVSDLFDLYNYASKQKELYDLTNDINKYDTMLDLSLREYTKIIRTFMIEVHKKLVLEGAGYSFGENIGWICINRCLIHKSRPRLDFAATKKRKEELLKEGKRLYNKEEADWCKKNGIPYNGVDYRVYLNNEYCYEIPLLGTNHRDVGEYKLTSADYRGAELRGKTNDELIEMCNNDVNKICELPLDVKTKVTICDKIDKILYTKFIRNENQQPSTVTKVNRKNR